MASEQIPSYSEGRRPRASADLLVAAVLLGLGVLYGYQAFKEGIGTMASAGSGLFPFGVAVVLVAASFAVVIQERRAPEPSGPTASTEEETDVDDEVHWWRIVGVLVASSLVPVIGNTVGFVVTLSIVLVIIAKVMGLPGWRNALLLGAGFGLAVWLIFVQWLFVPLPAGVLGLM